MKNHIKIITIMVINLCVWMLCAKSTNIESQTQINLFQQGKRLLTSVDETEKNKGENILYELSQNNLQLSISIGTLLKKSGRYTYAIKVYEYALSRGDFISGYELGMLYLDQETPVNDYHKAFEVLMSIADKYNMSAFQVGEAFLCGRGCKKNEELALSYFLLATQCRKNEVPCEMAFLRVAEAYENGRGCKKNFFNAWHYYSMAEKNGFSGGTLIDYKAKKDSLQKKMKP